MRWKYLYLVMAINLLTIFLGLSACSTPPPSETGSGKLQVVATTTIVSDILKQVGGDKIALTTLLPWGVDPHSYEPVPQDIARASDADVIFAHGAGLEGFLQILLESASAEGKIVHVSDGIKLLQTTDLNHTEDGHPDDGYESGDPHTWTDPNNVMIWVQNIQNKLSEMDPDNAGYYQENAGSYLTELQNLDAWIRSEIDKIPLDNRKIVTDHLLFGYFCAAYGFEQVGALVPAYSTVAEPSARDLAELEDAIGGLAVKAIFVGNTVNPNLAERVVADTGIQLVPLYTGSLTEAGGEADTYLKYMHYNINAFIEALK